MLQHYKVLRPYRDLVNNRKLLLPIFCFTNITKVYTSKFRCVQIQFAVNNPPSMVAAEEGNLSAMRLSFPLLRLHIISYIQTALRRILLNSKVH
jgi:hypothetical protein